MNSRRLMKRPLRADDCTLSHCPALEAMLRYGNVRSQMFALGKSRHVRPVRRMSAYRPTAAREQTLRDHSFGPRGDIELAIRPSAAALFWQMPSSSLNCFKRVTYTQNALQVRSATAQSEIMKELTRVGLSAVAIAAAAALIVVSTVALAQQQKKWRTEDKDACVNKGNAFSIK